MNSGSARKDRGKDNEKEREGKISIRKDSIEERKKGREDRKTTKGKHSQVNRLCYTWYILLIVTQAKGDK